MKPSEMALPEKRERTPPQNNNDVKLEQLKLSKTYSLT
jgi:hypothetical protein